MSSLIGGGVSGSTTSFFALLEWRTRQTGPSPVRIMKSDGRWNPQGLRGRRAGGMHDILLAMVVADALRIAFEGGDDEHQNIHDLCRRPVDGFVGLSAAVESKEYLKGDRPQQRGYSEAVITEGGKIVWLAGQTATMDDNGKSLASDFEGQVRQLFKNLDRTLQKAGGKLGDMVQMTVFITDVRYGDRLTQIRREVFGDNFPGSALITITALAVPDAKIEIQGYAVIGGK